MEAHGVMEPTLHHSPSWGSNVGLLSPGIPGRVGFMQQDGQEVQRRQAEWEREIESLDQKEMELHQSQLKLIREQTAIFIRDLASLQQDVDRLKSAQVHHAPLLERMDYVEKVLGDSAEKYAHDLKAAHGKLDELHGRFAEHQGSTGEREASLHRRVEYLEQALGESANKQQKDSQAVRAAHARLQEDLARAHQDKHASVVERVNYIEKLLGDSADQHAKELKAAHAKFDQLHVRLSEQHGSLKEGHGSLQSRLEAVEKFVKDSVDRHSRDLDAAKASQAKLHQDAKVRDSQHGAVEQRLKDLEGVCAEHMDKHGKELDLAGNRLDQLQGRLSEHHAQLVHHASLQERVSYVEKLMGDSREKHDEALADAHSKIDHMRNRVSVCEAHGASIEGLKKSHHSIASDKAKHDANHKSLAERLDYLEGVMQKFTDQHSRDGADSKAKLDHLHGRLAACEKHAPLIGDLQKGHAGLLSDKAATESHHATLRERVDYLEGMVGSSAEKHFKELEFLKTAHSRLATESKTREAFHATISERVSFIEQQLGDSADQQAQELAAAHSKLDQLHGRLASCEAHGSAIDNLKKSHANLAQDKATREAHHMSMAERLEYLERVLGDSAEKHARELASAQAKVDQLHGRLAACERAGAAVGDLQKAHSDMANSKATLASQHEAVKGEVEELHRMLSDHGEKHAKELESVKSLHNRLANDNKARDSSHAATASRLEEVEANMSGHAERHARELLAAHAKCDQLHGRLSEDRATHESHVRSLIANEKEMRDTHHATLKERVDYIESLLGESAETHRQELENLKSAQSKHAKEGKARDTGHASLLERLEGLERNVGEAHGKQSQELAAAHARLEQVHGRLHACEKQGQSLEEVHKAHAGMANDKAAVLDRSHASLREKVEYLESLVGDSVERHRDQIKEVESVRVAHSKLTTDMKQKEAKHASMEERLKYLEKLLDDSADKHAQELRGAAGRLDEMHARLAHCEAHGTAIEGLKRFHASMTSDQVAQMEHHATVAERLQYLEQVVGASADKHEKEIRAAHERLDQLHGHVKQEQAAREAHHHSMQGLLSKDRDGQMTHASVQKRLDSVEGLLNASASKFDQLDQKVNAVTQLLNQNMGNITDHLSAEKVAREAHERDVKTHVVREKSAREVHENTVTERFNHEKAARERHHGLLQDLIVREREERSKHHAGFHEELQRRGAAHEASHKELHDVILKERSHREQHQAAYTDATMRDKAARGSIEELLAQERAERSRHHDTVAERVDSLQRTVNIFDGLIRKEMDERTKENRRIWDAIDNHTHDLSTQVITDGGFVAAAGGSASLAEPSPPVLSPCGGGGGPCQEPLQQRWIRPPPMLPTTAVAPVAPFSWPGHPPVAPAAPAEAVVTLALPPGGLSGGLCGGPCGPLAAVRPLSPTPSTTTLVRPLTTVVSPAPGAAAAAAAAAAMSMSRPRSAGPASPSGHGQFDPHHVERVTVGHTRYGNERLRAAELLME